MYFDILFRLQRMYIRLRADRSWQIVHDDGQTGGRPRRHNTTGLQGLVSTNKRRLERGCEALGGGELHGDLLRARARLAQSQEQGQPSREGASVAGTLRRRSVQACSHDVRGHSRSHRGG